MRCPKHYCPKDDSIFQVACLPPSPCFAFGGCFCKANYLRTNDEEERCILASDCPPIECTRKNEIWNPCPGPCFTEYCGSEVPKTCNNLVDHMCRPQCVCLKNYRRYYTTNECIPENDCPAVV
ncbi:inducible metalloproteinase inhibitor protein-like [Bicyclus anynana]|uniref:Inducible metalloproteinase inhibitor protein-like n=1 Tax=Bicyclus anynana TaxID=110368 RepID=A0ABM3LLC6_BICAN|nr:inducible metalloproteinase inhibitor protein-like [Bicyclus anynana]